MNDSARLEFLEADAWAQRETALPSAIKERLGTRARRFGRAVALATPGADVAAVNRAIGLGLETPLDAELLGAILQYFRDAGVGRWLVELSPNAKVLGGRATVTSQGGVLKTPTAKLFGDLRDISITPPMNGLSVAEIGPDAADAYRTIVGGAFGLPQIVEHDLVSTLGQDGWHYYMAYDDERPIAGAAMFAMDDGAWFGVCGTSSDARNRGAQTALLARRLVDARKLGCSWVTAETAPDTADHPNPSYRNMRRAGMQLAYLRDKYVFERGGRT